MAKILLTAAFTLFGGIVLFCSTTITNKLFFDPILTLRKDLGDISFSLQYHAWAIHAGPGVLKRERSETIFEELRTLTARMRADADAIIGYKYAVRCGLIPPHQDVISGAGRLIRLSNTLESEKWDLKNEDWQAVSKLLCIDVGGPNYYKAA